ncbi:hypothetical protein IG631_15766 [Alternaria alternata]|nr:hypothetical protein IG631_15766 [Alternaria alternata]
MLHDRLSPKQRHLRHLALRQSWLPIVSAVTVRTGLPQVSLVELKYYSSTTCYTAFVLETKHTPPKQNQSRSTLPRYWSTNHELMAGAIHIRPPTEDPKAHSAFLHDFPSSVDQLIPSTGRISDMQSLLSFTSLSLLVLPTVAMTGMVGTCYFANGTALPTDPIYNQYQPCQSGGPSAICCGIFRDNVAGGNVTAGDTVDECLPNGLCQNRATTTDGVEETK